MITPSPLAAICHVITQVRHRATADALIFQKNEAATRAALIDPILRALGWDTTNVRLVEPERTVENKQSLDYVLKDHQGHIRTVVEAKKLGESLDKLGHVGAIIGYAFSLKPQNFFITDGINWHCYSPSHSHYQPVGILNLQSADLATAGLQLVQWLDAAQSGHGLPIPNSEDVPEPSVIPAAGNNAAQPASQAAPKTPKAASTNFIELDQLQQHNLAPGQKPKQLRLPDGTVKPIAKWKDILVEVCRMVLATNPNLAIPLPDKAGKKTFLLTTTKPAIGSSTLASYKNRNVFIYTNYSAAACISNALHALKQVPATHQKTTLAVRF